MRLWRPLQRPWTWNQPRPFRCVLLDVFTCTCNAWVVSLIRIVLTKWPEWLWQISPWNGKARLSNSDKNVGFFLPCACMRSGVMCLVASVYVYIQMYYVAKKLVVWGLTAWKSFFGAIYCSLIEFNHQKRSLLCQVIHLGKEIQRHSINGMRKGSLENCITVSHALSTHNAASYAMLLRLQCRHHYRYRL